LLAASLGGALAAFAPGCRDATQMTLEIALAPNVVCSELRGTAISVGVDPDKTEKNRREGYVTASTNACDMGSRMVGTLVVTPSDDGRASVIVVAAYDSTLSSPTTCMPPDYKGCIVARRRFSFTSHKGLRLPITIDPDCKNVPCDALSTCRKGNCYSSEVVIEGDVVPPEPGALPDGGTSEAGVIIPEGGNPDVGPEDGSVDGPEDAPSDSFTPDGPAPDGGPPAGVSCNGGTLYCPDSMGMPTACSGSLFFCCEVPPGSSIECRMNEGECKPSSNKYCCSDLDCGLTVLEGGAGFFAVVKGPVCRKPPPMLPDTVGTCGAP
jgi:hypothetical protein